jgi:hypothetical protein
LNPQSASGRLISNQIASQFAYPPVIPYIDVCLAVAILIGYLAKGKGRS